MNKTAEWPLYALSLYFILSPFYVLGSGLPQPADWILGILFLYILTKTLPRWSGDFKKLLNNQKLFVGYVVLVNAVWFFGIDQSQEKRFPSIVFSLFYIFNYLAVLSIMALYKTKGHRVLKFTIYGIGLSLMLQTALSLVTGTTASRNPLFFNNPNQLGYYALLSGSLIIYAVRTVNVNKLFQLVSYFCFFYLTLLSASKAALSGSILLIGLAFLNQGFTNLRQLVVMLLVFAGGYYFIFSTDLGSNLFGYSTNRFEQIGQGGDDSYEGRGYDRILNDPEYLILGAGEGGYNRFETLLDAGEIHSSFGTVIFCYGIPGTIFFFLFLFTVFKRSSWIEMLYAIPIFVYSITHNGLRDTFFWVFLALIFILNSSKNKLKTNHFGRSKNHAHYHRSGFA